MRNKNLILIILSIILLIIIINKYEFFIVNENKWLNYRLGDVIKGDRKLAKNYTGSIAQEYVNLTQNLEKKYNFDVLNKIIENRKKNSNITIPGKNDIVIHIRLGDTITNFKNNKFNRLRKNWSTDVNLLDNILKELKPKYNKSKVYLVYGAHKKNINLKANQKFLDTIESIIKKYNFKFEKINNNPDEDFLFMCNSKIFIKSGGGFSRIISQIVKQKGGIIYDPKV